MQIASTTLLIIFYRCSMWVTLLLSVHRLLAIRSPTHCLVIHPHYFHLILAAGVTYFTLSEIIKYSTSAAACLWNPAVHMVWPEKKIGLVGNILLTCEMVFGFTGVLVASVWTVVLLKRHERTVRRSEQIARSAVTILLLSANTLFLFVSWVVVRLYYSYATLQENLFVPTLRQHGLLWMPPLLHSVVSPLIIVVRNNMISGTKKVSKEHAEY